MSWALTGVKLSLFEFVAIHSHAGVWGMQLSALLWEGRILSGRVRQILVV